MTVPKWIVVWIVIVAVFIVGAYSGVRWFAPVLTQRHDTTAEKTLSPVIVQGETKTETKTEIQYVPKETIVYRDPLTGQAKSAPEPTDVQVTAPPPGVNVRLNGQPYNFTLLQGETQKFDQGKLVLDQTSTVGVDVRMQPAVIDNTPSGGIDFYAGNRDAGIGFRHNRIGLDVGYNFRDKGIETRFRWRAIQFK